MAEEMPKPDRDRLIGTAQAFSCTEPVSRTSSLIADEELEEQVKLAAEQYIPFDINEVNFDFHILNAMDQSEDGEPQMYEKFSGLRAG